MLIENKTFDELTIGATAELKRLCTQDDLIVFANVSGNHNPLHLYDRDGDGDGRNEAVAPGLYLGAIISAVLGNILPGAGTLYRAQSLRFHARAHAGEELLARVTVTAKVAETRGVTLATELRRASDDTLLLSGEAEVEAPKVKIHRNAADVPGLILQRHRHFEALLERAAPLPALRTAVVCPEEVNSLGGA
ncbi:MaoC/PaaZ C-terminal domain-containing protein, partial [Oceanicola sp. S124]|uniref:MaoC/PaaZ C-terminal domain-containing protein n=1 Tax=Oceanicola sp. S124 TaxID=1042378 RepID=UPI0002557AAA